ncbi:ribosome-recycling factor, mitochondrial isoform X2 [Dipodomys merriami]
MALGLKCFRLIHPAFCSYLTTLTRPISEITVKTMSGRQPDHRQYMACTVVPVRHFATKKAKAKGKGQSQTRVNINIALVEDIINLEEVDEEMKSVTEALKDNFNKTLNIRTSPGSLDNITVVTADGKLTLNQIGQISMKSPQLILVNMASFPEGTETCSEKSEMMDWRQSAIGRSPAMSKKAKQELKALSSALISQMADDTVAELDRHLAVKTKELLG